MIESFADRETELVYNQKFSQKLPVSIQKTALRKLMMIDNAKTLEDLRVPPEKSPQTHRSGSQSSSAYLTVTLWHCRLTSTYAMQSRSWHPRLSR